jgi:hypothetical protein
VALKFGSHETRRSDFQARQASHTVSWTETSTGPAHEITFIVQLKGTIITHYSSVLARAMMLTASTLGPVQGETKGKKKPRYEIIIAF